MGTCSKRHYRGVLRVHNPITALSDAQLKSHIAQRGNPKITPLFVSPSQRRKLLCQLGDILSSSAQKGGYRGRREETGLLSPNEIDELFCFRNRYAKFYSRSSQTTKERNEQKTSHAPPPRGETRH